MNYYYYIVSRLKFYAKVNKGVSCSPALFPLPPRVCEKEWILKIYLLNWLVSWFLNWEVGMGNSSSGHDGIFGCDFFRTPPFLSSSSSSDFSTFIAEIRSDFLRAFLNGLIRREVKSGM